jgi:hypothetical protein
MEVCPLLHSVLKYSIKLKPLGQAWHAYCAAKVSLYSGVVDCLGEYATSDDFKTLRNDNSYGEWYYYKNK